MSFPKFHYNDATDLLPLVTDLLATRQTIFTCRDSSQQVGNFSVYGEVTGKRVQWILSITIEKSAADVHRSDCAGDVRYTLLELQLYSTDYIRLSVERQVRGHVINGKHTLHGATA